MQKLLLISILVTTMALPMRAARDGSAVRGLRRALAWAGAFNLFYLVAILYLYPRLH